MYRLTYCNVDDLDLSKGYELVPKERQDKINHYRFDKDKKLSCGAYLLLKKLLNEENITNPEFKYGKYDKAYISNYPHIHFNLSHSRKIVACLISDKVVGVDVEYIDHEIDLDIAKNYFFHEEYDNIINSKNPPDEFFNYWVLKESYMKYTGLGFNLSLDSFTIQIDDEIKLKNDVNGIKFNLFDIGEYKLASASKYDIRKCEKWNVNDIY